MDNSRTNNSLVHKANESFKKGYQLTNEGKYPEAIQAYTEAIRILPTYYEAIDNRGFLKMRLGDYEGATSDFELSIQVESQNHLSHAALGECCFYLKDYKRAHEEMQKALEIEERPLARDWLGKIERVLKGDADLMDDEGRAKKKVFFVLRLVTQVEGKGNFGLIIHDGPRHKEGQPYSLYASRIMPGQTPRQAIDKVFTEDLRRPPKYKMGQIKFTDYAKDKLGLDIPRFDIYVLTEYFPLEGIKLAGSFASWMPITAEENK